MEKERERRRSKTETKIAGNEQPRIADVVEELDRRGIKVDFGYSGYFGNMDSDKKTDIADFADMEQSKLSTFPMDALPSVLREYAIAVAESIQVSGDMVAVALLGIAAACMQGIFIIEPKPDWQEPLNLYILIVAAPSERKTPILKEITRPVYDYVAAENERRQPFFDKYVIKKNILSKRVASLTEMASNPKKGSKQQVTMQDVLDAQEELAELEAVTLLKLIVDDITTEALARVMKENNERISIMSAEGGIFGMLAGRYSNQPNMDIFLKAYSGERYCSDRMTRKGEDLINPLLTLLLMVQPIVANEAMQNKEFRERGLLARFLYSIPNSKVGARLYDTKPIDPEVRKKYDDLVNDLLSMGRSDGNPENKVIRFNQGAYELSASFFNEIEKQLLSEYEDIEDWAGKYHGQTMRIAGLLHCINHKWDAPEVYLQEQTMKDAIQIGRYFLEHAKAAFRIAGISTPQEEKDAKYILGKLRENHYSQNPQNPQNVRVRDLYKECKFRTMEELQPGLAELEKRNFIRINKVKNGKAGRPTEVIEVNPAYWERQAVPERQWTPGEF